MKFKSYDILSSLIPGFLILIAGLRLFNVLFDKDLVIPYTALAFLFGYVVNAVSSWLEDFYYLTWGGKPSSVLLDGKDIWKVRFYHGAKIKELLLADAEKASASNDELFSIAMRIANGEGDSRAEDFNAQYAFSRALLTTVLIGSVGLLIQNYSDWRFYAVVIPTLVAVWLRCKQRGYYYAKEILTIYLQSKQK